MTRRCISLDGVPIEPPRETPDKPALGIDVVPDMRVKYNTVYWVPPQWYAPLIDKNRRLGVVTNVS